MYLLGTKSNSDYGSIRLINSESRIEAKLDGKNFFPSKSSFLNALASSFFLLSLTALIEE
jgi:hypothetical protein